jgi:TolB protein
LALPVCVSALGSGSSGRIGYLRPLGGNEPPYGHLFAVNIDGTGGVDLTPAGYTDVRSFAWSPDGRRVVFSAIQNGDLDPELFLMNAEGGDVRRLTDNHLPDSQPSWSPDSRSIAFTSIRTGLAQVYRMRTDGTGQKRLTAKAVACDSPAWSPRGTLIAFHCSTASEKIWLMHPDGTHVHALLRQTRTMDVDPAWSPDGRLLAFARSNPPPFWRPRGIWTIKPDGAGLRQLLPNGADPTFSRDGKAVAFVWEQNGNQELYTASASGTGIAQITMTYGVVEAAPDWGRSP